jgi:hypothetical protein
MKNVAGAWLVQIEGARSSADLVRIVREYLVALGPESRATLPRQCDADRIAGGAEIQECAVMLAQEDLKSSRPTADDTLHEAATVFAAASAKLPKLAG